MTVVSLNRKSILPLKADEVRIAARPLAADTRLKEESLGAVM